MPACPFCKNVLAYPADIERGACAECRVAIWQVLFEECFASVGDGRDQFLYHFPRCVEFRFGGALGFGGKVWWSHQRLYVSCYPEDRTPSRLDMIERANARLAALVKEA